MTMQRGVKIFESGSGKWIRIRDEVICYTSSRDNATEFDLPELKSANQMFADFSIYKETLFAVPFDIDCHPWECKTVRDFISAEKETKL